MDKKRFGPALLLFVAFVSAFAGLVPLFRGGRVNGVFIAVAFVWLILALAAMKAQRTSTAPPSALPPDAPE